MIEKLVARHFELVISITMTHDTCAKQAIQIRILFILTYIHIEYNEMYGTIASTLCSCSS